MNREDEEIKLLAVPKNPYLSKAVSQNYSFNHTLWKLKELHESHGGNPTIDDVIKLKGSIRYKLIYPDGKVDYARVEAFSKYYNYEPAK